MRYRIQSRARRQHTITRITFNPIDYGFSWLGDWYMFDCADAHKTAKRERDIHAAQLRKEGYFVKKSCQPGCLISRGGIGSDHPHIEEVVTIYDILYQ